MPASECEKGAQLSLKKPEPQPVGPVSPKPEALHRKPTGNRGYKFGEFDQFPLPQMLSSSMEEVVLQSKARLFLKRV